MSKCNDACKYYKHCWSRGEGLKEDGEECISYEPDRPHGKWEGDPERKKMVTRICTSCGDRSVVGYFCMWCGADMRQKEGESE